MQLTKYLKKNFFINFNELIEFSDIKIASSGKQIIYLVRAIKKTPL